MPQNISNHTPVGPSKLERFKLSFEYDKTKQEIINTVRMRTL